MVANEESMKNDNSDKIKVIKRPISLTLIILLGAAFLLALLLTIFPLKNFSISSLMIPFLIFMPIIFIISLILIPFNRRIWMAPFNRSVSQKRTKVFAISSAASVALLILAIVFFIMFVDHFETGNSQFDKKQYEAAIGQYNLVIEQNKDLQNVELAKSKIIKANSFINQANNFAAKGDEYFKNGLFDEAITEYNSAKEIYPFLKGIDLKISYAKSQFKKAEESIAIQEREINDLLVAADKLFSEKKYEEALNKYNEILNIKSDNNTAKQRTEKINEILAETNNLIKDGDKLFNNKDYQNALYKYEQVQQLYPFHSLIDLKISQAKKEIEKINSTTTELVEVTTTTKTSAATTQESLQKFSFDEYITANVREYNLVKEEDISLKALGDKLPSEYTQAEIDKLPINFRMKYCVVIPRDITEEELKSTLANVIKTKSYQNLSIDEIYIAAWYDLESVEKEVCLARAEWCPEGRWEQMPPIIAENDIRDSYLIKFYFNSPIEQQQVKYGLTEQQRKQAFYDMVVLEDKIPIDDPNYDEKMDNVEVTIAQKYGITIEQVRAIGIEGVTKGWPMPPIE
jgi:tetratricopeptide (TPR) repeat protein